MMPLLLQLMLNQPMSSLMMKRMFGLPCAPLFLPEFFCTELVFSAMMFLPSFLVNWLAQLLDVRQPPRLLEQRLLRAVEAEENLEPSVGARGNPVRFLAVRGFRAEVDVHRAVVVLLQSRRLGRAARPAGVTDGRVCVAVVDGRRPVLPDRGVRGHRQAI